MDYRRDLLLRSAARLYSLGIEVEAAREQLRKLAAEGVSYDSAEMRNALEEYQQLDSQWKKLEQEHLGLREQILQEEKS